MDNSIKKLEKLEERIYNLERYRADEEHRIKCKERSQLLKKTKLIKSIESLRNSLKDIID